jgi:hypothetical protein
MQNVGLRVQLQTQSVRNVVGHLFFAERTNDLMARVRVTTSGIHLFGVEGRTAQTGVDKALGGHLDTGQGGKGFGGNIRWDPQARDRDYMWSLSVCPKT